VELMQRRIHTKLEIAFVLVASMHMACLEMLHFVVTSGLAPVDQATRNWWLIWVVTWCALVWILVQWYRRRVGILKLTRRVAVAGIVGPGSLVWQLGWSNYFLTSHPVVNLGRIAFVAGIALYFAASRLDLEEHGWLDATKRRLLLGCGATVAASPILFVLWREGH
jgi:hypothetical protein